MTNDSIYLLKPVFNFLDSLIRDQGDRLYVVFVYVCLFVIGWILSGGLRRRFARQAPNTWPTIIVIRPTVPPPPLPPLPSESPEHVCWSSDGQEEDSFAA